MARPLTRTQALQNRAFLSALRRTGNVRLACRVVGLKYSTMQHRRSRHPAFALRWDAALVFAQASFDKLRMSGKGRGAAGSPLPARACARIDPSTIGSSANGPPPRASSGRSDRAFRTAGGEMVMVRLKNRTLQMRRAQAGKLTPAAEQAFLSALSVTCNVSLAAAAVGACFNAFNRRRKKDPAFAREWRLALQSGYLELETALLASTLAQSHEHDDWRNNDPPAMPPMTVNQALQLMYLHHKEARLNAVEPHQIRRRPREPEAAYHERLVQMAEARLQRQREDFEVAEAARMERGERAWRPAGEALRQAQGGPSIRRCAATQDERTSIRRSAATQDERSAFGLPDLAQVTGWSNADPGKAPHDPRRALFGGWRIEEMEKKLSEATRSEPAGRTVIWMARGR